jgi:hypothetical protein
MSARANTTSHSEWSASPDKSFITTKAFPLEFYQYTASRAADLSMKGELVLHKDATANRCPAGRVLHANGKKLIPGVNPMTVFTSPAGATVQAPKFMIGVYDPGSMLNGFIDPTSATFAVYDKNRPASAYLAEATGNVAEATAVAALGGQGATIRAQTTSAGSGSIGSLAATMPNNSTGTATVLNAGIKATSLVFVTPLVEGVVATVTAVNAGTSFVVTLRNVTSAPISSTFPFNWLVVN